MQSDFSYTVWFFCALILYACARELIPICWNSLEKLGIDSKPNYIAGFMQGSGFTLGSIC
jgi:hypothetical protein